MTAAVKVDKPSPNGSGAQTFDPARLMAAVAALPDAQRGPVEQAIGAALGGLLRNEAPPTLKVLSAAQALEPVEPVPAVVNNLFAHASLNALIAGPKRFKSWTGNDMCAAVATGRNWQGFQTRQGGALIISEENGGAVDHRRLGMTLRGWNAGAETPIYCASLPRLNFKSHTVREMVRDFISAHGIAFVVIDSWVDVLALAGADENSSSETQAIAMNLRQIAEDTGAALLLLHHENRAGSYRGSSSLPGVVDTLITLKRNGNVLTFHVEYSRQFEAPDDFSALVNFTPDSFNLSPTLTLSDEPHYSKSQDYVLRFLREHGPSSVSTIKASADKCTGEAAKRAVYSLADLERIYRTNPGKPGDAVYAVRSEAE